MLLDYNSLLLAIGFSGACLCVTMFGSWLSAPKERFMLTWSIGVLLIVANVVAYDLYVKAPGPLIGVMTFSLLLAGLSALLGASFQFRTRRSPMRIIVASVAASFAVVLPPMAFGYDGLSFMFYNAAAAALLFATAREYWRCRREAPVPILGLAGLYSALGLSFVACAAMLALPPRMVLDGPPENWAEELNIVAAIVGMTGIGALSLALNHWRLARAHRQASVTDQLTGLLNRRALFERHESDSTTAVTAVVLFDLDHFKTLNDQHGHAVGDQALRIFALAMKANLGPGETAARLGGEEFVAVLPNATADRAERVAQGIRRTFAGQAIVTEDGDVRCTVSAGIAFGGDGVSFERVLLAADEALYAAKRAGRDRVERRNLKLVG